MDSRFRGNDCEFKWRRKAASTSSWPGTKSGADVIDELQREYDDLKRRANELRSFL